MEKKKSNNGGSASLCRVVWKMSYYWYIRSMLGTFLTTVTTTCMQQVTHYSGILLLLWMDEACKSSCINSGALISVMDKGVVVYRSMHTVVVGSSDVRSEFLNNAYISIDTQQWKREITAAGRTGFPCHVSTHLNAVIWNNAQHIKDKAFNNAVYEILKTPYPPCRTCSPRAWGPLLIHYSLLKDLCDRGSLSNCFLFHV